MAYRHRDRNRRSLVVREGVWKPHIWWKLRVSCGRSAFIVETSTILANFGEFPSVAGLWVRQEESAGT